MADLNKYRNCIRELLAEHAKYLSSYQEIEAQIIADLEGDHYQLLYVGWQNQQRFFGSVMHFDIKDNKVWIQFDSTEEEVGDRRSAMGYQRMILLWYFIHLSFVNSRIMQ